MAEEYPVIDAGCRDPARLRFVQPGEIVQAGRGLITRGGPSNWITAGWWLNETGTPITCYRAQWKVPKPPTDHCGQYLYLFNGMQPGSQMILQPVLSWGRFGPCWKISSWIYPDLNGHPRSTNPIQVEPGQVLTGVIRLVGEGANGFDYRCEFEGFGETILHGSGIPELIYGAVSLEAYEGAGSPPYELSAPRDYPSAKRTRFRRIQVESTGSIVQLDWEPVNYLQKNSVPNFGEHTTVVNGSSTKGRVDIFYGS
jgi:hypothetical protein